MAIEIFEEVTISFNRGGIMKGTTVFKVNEGYYCMDIGVKTKKIRFFEKTGNSKYSPTHIVPLELITYIQHFT